MARPLPGSAHHGFLPPRAMAQALAFAVPTPTWDELDMASVAFYRHVLQSLNDKGVPFLVGGAFSFACFTGIERDTKDLDLFIRRSDLDRVRQAMDEAGYRTELTYPHWLAKVHCGEAFVDLIFNSGNGMGPVDDEWFAHARDAEILDVPVKVSPAEESLWSKAFIMERERYDGADVAHLLKACAEHLDWPRLLRRFGPNWRVLLSHLVLFGFIYPGERDRIPSWVMSGLLEALRQEDSHPAPASTVCAGTLLSRAQYLHDVEQQGCLDVRLTPASTMTPQDVADWTRAIPSRQTDGPQPAGQ